jgi:type I restriction enzyme M protein
MKKSSDNPKTLDTYLNGNTRREDNEITSQLGTSRTYRNEKGQQRPIASMNDIVSFAWGAKEILRGDFKKSKYGDIILPFIVLRRLERILEPTKEKVLAEHEKIKKMDDKVVEARLNQITRQYFHNRSKFNLDLLLADEKNIFKNMKSYIDAFSQNVRDVFDNFGFDDTIDNLHKQKLLYQIVQHFAKADLDPDKIDNHMMGTVYEELIRKTSEAANEEAGDHFTPREVIRLMVNLLFANEKEVFKQKHIIRTIYDPAAGTGGMLSVASEHVLKINQDVL